MPIALPQCSGYAASGRHSHSSCDRSPIHHLRSLLRHPRHCGGTVEPATRDKIGSALFPSLFCQLRPSGLYLIIRMALGPPSAGEEVRCHHGPLEEECPSPAAGVPDPPRGVRDLHATLGPPNVHPSTPSRGSGAAACPATAGARRTLTCRARSTTPRHIWKTVHPTTTTTPPAGAGRTPARSTQDQGRYPGRLPRPTPCPTVYFLQCSTAVPLRFGGKRRLSRPPLMYTAPPYDYKRRRRASFRTGRGF